MIYLICLIYTFCVGHKWNVLQILPSLSTFSNICLDQLEDSSAPRPISPYALLRPYMFLIVHKIRSHFSTKNKALI